MVIISFFKGKTLLAEWFRGLQIKISGNLSPAHSFFTKL